jgi:ribonuclease P protein component
MSALGKLLQRAEFLAVAATSKKSVAPGVIVQWALRSDSSSIRYGLTASRKVGGAVQRNRARRRLRALAIELLPQANLPPCDIVLIARTATVTRSFTDLRHDIAQALSKVRA